MNLQDIKAVLFDLDGVITDTDDIHYASWKESVKPYGVDLTKELYFKHLQSRDYKEGIPSLIDNLSDKEISDIYQVKNKVARDKLSGDIKIYEDAMDLIKYLYNKNITLAVVSASTSAEFVVKNVGLDQYFDFVISSGRELNLKNKPNPDIYLHAMKKLDVNPKDTIIIEDSISGIKAGLASGPFVYGVKRNKLNINDENLTLVNDLYQVKEDLR